HWYLPFDKYQPWLEEWLLEGKKGKWKNNVYGQCSSWLKEGLLPRSMTRDLDWGVDVPLPEAKGKKLYVWLDAPIGYISATKQWAIDNGKDWEKYWKLQDNPEDNPILIHFIGKDNIVFHCITFPSILHAHGEFVVPENVPANEFLNLEGDKMSTSRNHAVWLHEYLNDFPEKEDVLRYVLCSIMPEQKDADFTWKDYQARNNNELVKILGNLINRIIILTNKYFQGVVPDPGDLSKNERAMEAFSQIHEYIGNVENSIENFRFREAQSEFMNVARVGNKYLTDEEPWKKWKTDPEAVKPALYVGLQIIAQLGILAKPFLPRTAEKIFDLLNIDGSNLNWDDLSKEGLVEAGHTIQTEKVNVLFEQIEDKVIDEQKDKLEAAAKEAESKFPPMKEEIEFEDFQKMDIRIGTILEASKVEKADKLLQFKVDTGIDVRTIVSGVAKHFEPEFMVGKQIPVLMNLKPRKIRGVVSQGMILFAEDSEEALHLLTPQKDIESGSSVN
ncbi:MAG: methionine--tRNA ligase subunit beta, partial [Bacteroidetes bacterium]|nr:methionine--tRNA ligase subunit beta [Bacteroidota bacterium]